jgi:hypothetical protein
MTIPLPAGLQNSHQNGGRLFSSSWRILEPYGRAQLDCQTEAFLLGNDRSVHGVSGRRTILETTGL